MISPKYATFACALEGLARHNGGDMAATSLALQLSGDVFDALGDVCFLQMTDQAGWRLVDRIQSSDLAVCKSSEDALALLEAKISYHSIGAGSGVRWIIAIPPFGPNGFAIRMSVEPGRIVGLFGALEHEFSTVFELLDWVCRALSSQYQLRTTFRGDCPVAWYLEVVDPCAVRSSATLGTGIVTLRNFWKSKRTTIRQNVVPGETANGKSNR